MACAGSTRSSTPSNVSSPASFTDDDAWELMTILCGAIAHKFPAVIWKGAGVEDTVTLFKAAENYAAATRHLKGRIVVTRPFARRKIDRVQDFWAEIGAWLDREPRKGKESASPASASAIRTIIGRW